MKLPRIIGTMLLAVVILGIIIISSKNLHDSKSTIFYVTIPAATPDMDTITLNIEGEVLPMQRVSDTQYMLEVDTRGYESGRPIRYGYVRGGFINIFGEAGEHITLGNVGNRTFIPGAKDNIINDIVSEWKWFPNEPVTQTISSAAASYQIAPRQQFMAGPMLVDFWNNNFPLQYDSTKAHLQDIGYNWISLAPPWDYDTVDPPIIKNNVSTVPAWPEEELRKEIREFKSAGFKIMLDPQVCCRKISFENRSESWWRTWYNQYKNFLRFHSALAKEEGIDAIFFSAPQDSMPGNRNAPSFASEEWDELWAAVKEAGVPVGFAFHVLPPGDKPSELWPQEAAQFYSKMDFVALSMWNHVSDKEFPTQSEIDNGMDRLYVEIDYNHNISGKPFVFGQVAYFSVNGSAMRKGVYEEYPSWDDPRKYEGRLDWQTQAMIYESHMKHIASRNYIQGFFPFGYYYATAPKNLDSDIRGKPAENVLSAWVQRLIA